MAPVTCWVAVVDPTVAAVRQSRRPRGGLAGHRAGSNQRRSESPGSNRSQVPQETLPLGLVDGARVAGARRRAPLVLPAPALDEHDDSGSDREPDRRGDGSGRHLREPAVVEAVFLVLELRTSTVAVRGQGQRVPHRFGQPVERVLLVRRHVQHARRADEAAYVPLHARARARVWLRKGRGFGRRILNVLSGNGAAERVWLKKYVDMGGRHSKTPRNVRFQGNNDAANHDALR